MKILFLVDPLQNYVSDPLYLGLVRVLGQHQVIHYPPKPIYHDPSAKLWFLPQLPKSEKTEAEVRALLDERFFELVCVASPRPEPLKTLSRLYNPRNFPPLVFIDETDDVCIRHEIVARYPVAVYFKREYSWKMGSRFRDLAALTWAFRGNRQLFSRTFPLSMSVAMDAFPDLKVNKDIDVSYTGRTSHPRRVKAMRILAGMEGIRFSGSLYASPGDRKYKLRAGWLARLASKVFENQPAAEADYLKKKAPTDYYREIAASRIAICLRGGGWMTPRYFEIIAMGTFMLSERPEIVIPNDFEQGRHAIFCKNDLSDLQHLVRHYLRDDKERERIAREGRAHLLKYHTCERRAEYFLDVCARMI